MSRRGAIPIRRVAGASAARLLVVLAALAGLFAMHGMSEHGVAHHDSSSMSAESPSGDAMAMGLGAAASVADAAADVQTGAAVTATAAGDLVGHGADMAMTLCLAVLAGLVLLLTRGRGLWVGLVMRPIVAGADARMARTARDPVPPDLFVLSIQRC
ncbi:DUF6153 family protein [Nocardioides psychrotolerans]|uniref:Uncharacterized protein n=1 Tax=Nocardioides psychrotolerans TaxID=1005945 RepID=A0A1I3IT50_9ACTN|nr:DUF6153 family protein [Nocardioides psychrotolerans]SFI51115.1 hypothetical protein SAMN05216561_109136 [Nocardioides psychrotolerans]